MDLDRVARRAVENGEFAAQLEIKDLELRRSLIRNFRTALEDTLTRQLEQIRELRTVLKKAKAIVGASAASVGAGQVREIRIKVHREIENVLAQESWNETAERVKAEEEE